jgi:hypothetical protein
MVFFKCLFSCAPCGPNWFLEQQRRLIADKERQLETVKEESQELSNSQVSRPNKRIKLELDLDLF